MAERIRVGTVNDMGAQGVVDATLIDKSDEVDCILRFSPKNGTVGIYAPVPGKPPRRIYSGEDLKVDDYVGKNTIKMITFVIQSIAIRQLQLYCSRFSVIFDMERTIKGCKFDDWVAECCKAYLTNKNRVE